MPKIYNTENNILLEINLINSGYLDVDPLRSDFENWIPFEFLLKVEKEVYSYEPKRNATFNLYELKNLVNEFQKIIRNKKEGCELDNFEFFSSEAYFNIIVNDPLEENLLTIEIWINVGTITDGKVSGYDKGFKFDVSLSDFEIFSSNLKSQLEKLCILD